MKDLFKKYSTIFRGIKMPWGMILVVLLLSVASSYLEVRQVTITASIIDATQNAIDLGQFVDFIVTLLAVSVIGILLSYSSSWTYQKINLGVRTKLWDKVLRLPTRFYDRENADALVSRVTTDASQSYMYVQTVINLVTAVYAAIVSGEQMYAYSPQLASYCLLILPAGAIISAVLGKFSQYTGFRAQSAFAASAAYLVERTRNLRLVKASLMEYSEQENGRKLFQKQFWAGILSVLSGSLSAVTVTSMNCVGLIIAFVLGGRLVAAGEISIAKLIGFYTISSILYVRLCQLIIYYGLLKEASGKLTKIAEIMDAAEESTDGIDLDVADADIRAENICFAYGERPVLNDLSFTIPKGKVSAIIGPNGAGKSTVFKLLERMYDPDDGRLCFGDTDVRQFSVASWRDSLAIVSQDKPLLSGTVRENILYGTRRTVTEEELIRVAKLANVYDFVMATPGGFDAQVGMDGSNFSGGQRQCIAIARAMMRNPDYLLLDEATSNLDAKSEALVSQALENLMEGRTTVMIAHNYSATRNADHIIVMKNGRVEAEGAPAELMQSNEYYRSFVSKSASFERSNVQ